MNSSSEAVVVVAYGGNDTSGGSGHGRARAACRGGSGSAARGARTDTLDQGELVGNCAVQAEHELELHHSRVEEGDFVEATMRRVEVSGLSGDGGAIELTVALDVACHAVDEMCH